MIGKIIRQARNSTEYSLDGLDYLLRSEFAARIEVYAFAWVFGALLLLRVPLVYLVSTLILFLVLLAVEALNTAVEVIIDRVSPEISPTGKRAKDLGSFSVMCLLTCNMLHLAFVLTRTEWHTLDERLREPGVLSIIACILFLVGIYGLTASRPRKVARWIMGAIAAIFAAGLVGFSAALTGVAAGLAGFVLGALVFDLIGTRRLGFSKHLSDFIHRRVRIGREDLTEDTRAAARDARVERPLRSAGIAGLAILAAIALHPAVRSIWI